MENGDDKNLETDGTSRFLRELSLPASEEDVPPKKRIKLDPKNQAASTECIDLESPSKNDSQTENQDTTLAAAVWDVVDPSGSVRGKEPVIVPSKGKETPPQKIQRLECTLNPPRDGKIPAPLADRPLGCKTISVSGIPMQIKEYLLYQIFKECKISSVKRCIKNVYHVTFSEEASVDRALKLNGYTVVSKEIKGFSYSGKMLIDYVSVWAEQQEYAKRMNSDQKESNPNDSKVTVTKPPLCPEFSKLTLSRLDRTWHVEMFVNNSANVFIQWMNEGRCNFYTRQYFYTTIMIIKKAVFRLLEETAKLKQSAKNSNCSLRAKYTANDAHFDVLLRVLNVATTNFVFNRFSNKQKRIIGDFKKELEKIKQSNSKALIAMSEKDENKLPETLLSAKNSQAGQQKAHLINLQKENEQLKNDLSHVSKDKNVTESSQTNHQNVQLVNLQKENERLKNELRRAQKDNSQKNQQQTQIHNLQKENDSFKNELKQAQKENNAQINNLSIQLINLRKENDHLKNELKLAQKAKENSQIKTYEQNVQLINLQKENERLKNEPKQAQKNKDQIDQSTNTLQNNIYPNANSTCSDSDLGIIANEARLIAAIGAFLNFYRFGETLENICKYLLRIDKAVTVESLECLMKKFPSVFKEKPAIPKGTPTKWIVSGI